MATAALSAALPISLMSPRYDGLLSAPTSLGKAPRDGQRNLTAPLAFSRNARATSITRAC